MVDGYKATGACEILTDPKYLNSYDYLKPGDILLNTAHHTATNLGIGKLSGYAAAALITPQTSNAAPSKETKWQGKVTTSKLSVRSWAGEENPTLSFSPLKKDTVVYVCDTSMELNMVLFLLSILTELQLQLKLRQQYLRLHYGLDRLQIVILLQYELGQEKRIHNLNLFLLFLKAEEFGFVIQ